MKNGLTAILFFTIFSVVTMGQTKKNISFDDLWKMERIGDFELSPDGKTIFFSSTIYDVDLNKGKTSIQFISSDGKGLTPFLKSDKNSSGIKISPDGKKVAYVLEEQIFICDINGQNSFQLTTISTGASGIVWSPDSKSILFVSAVYPELATDAENILKDEQKEKSKVKASIFTELMYRHWNDWRGEKRSHLFLVDLSTKEPVDLTLFSTADVPPLALGSKNDYCFSPDGKEIIFSTNIDKFIAASTNNDIFIIKVKDIKKGVTTPALKITEGKGNDFQPVYSSDGKYIAYCSMERAGFEADKHRIILYDRVSKTSKDISAKFDLSASEIIWSGDSKYIYFNAPFQIYQPIYKVDIALGEMTELVKNVYSENLVLSSTENGIYFKNQRSELPWEIFKHDFSVNKTSQVTFVNKEKLANIEMLPAETFWSIGAEGAQVQSLLIKPPFFDKNKKYPMIFLIHGGPQGHWNDDFHYRWNTQMFAAQGYVVVATNPRGSVGYGQKFTDEISGDWGGKAYQDLMNAYDYAVQFFPFIDKNNIFAAGASYGGYMINWIAGHTNRFNALVSHAGVFNLESMYGTTEELWFPEWEFGGTPWEKRSEYEKWSPHRFIQNCKTPVLVVHGAKDFRVPEEQAFQLFTSLQRLGVESKFLYFPDETHFVSKPQNARLWWNTLYQWFGSHIKIK